MSERTRDKGKPTVSRRDFLAKSALGAGAAAARGATSTTAMAADAAPNMPAIRVGDEFTKSRSEAPLEDKCSQQLEAIDIDQRADEPSLRRKGKSYCPQ